MKTETITHNGKEYFWRECLEDFAGNSHQPGFWADMWIGKDGDSVITLGGYWSYYAPQSNDVDRLDDMLDKCNIFPAANILPIFRAHSDPLHHVLAWLLSKPSELNNNQPI